MEKSNITKQAKSDIFKEIYPIINFYISKGATPQSLKKYYKNNKKFNDILDDIKNKGFNLINDESDYKDLVRTTLNDVLDDLIAKNKDNEYKNKKLKHIKEFYSYDDINENFMDYVGFMCSGFLLYRFIKSVATNYLNKKLSNINVSIINQILDEIKKLDKVNVSDFNDRYFIRLNIGDKNYQIRIMKEDKILNFDDVAKIQLSEQQYDDFLSLIKK